MDITEKKCSRCKIVQTVNSFCKNKCRPDGLSCWCNNCRKEVKLLTHPKKIKISLQIKICEVCNEEKGIRYFDEYNNVCKKCKSRRVLSRRQTVRDRNLLEGIKPIPYEFRKCTQCKIEKSINEFYKDICQVYGYSFSCKFCDKKEALAYSKTDKGRYNRYKSDAGKTNRNGAKEFSLTFEQFRNIIHQECFYCETNPSLGIDRFDNDRGYLIENCVPCCAPCNRIKLDSSFKAFVYRLIKIIETLTKKNFINNGLINENALRSVVKK